MLYIFNESKTRLPRQLVPVQLETVEVAKVYGQGHLLLTQEYEPPHVMHAGRADHDQGALPECRLPVRARLVIRPADDNDAGPTPAHDLARALTYQFVPVRLSFDHLAGDVGHLERVQDTADDRRPFRRRDEDGQARGGRRLLARGRQLHFSRGRGGPGTRRGL